MPYLKWQNWRKPVTQRIEPKVAFGNDSRFEPLRVPGTGMTLYKAAMAVELLTVIYKLELIPECISSFEKNSGFLLRREDKSVELE